MRVLRLSLVGTVILVLLGGSGGAVVAQSDDGDRAGHPGHGDTPECHHGYL